MPNGYYGVIIACFLEFHCFMTCVLRMRLLVLLGHDSFLPSMTACQPFAGLLPKTTLPLFICKYRAKFPKLPPICHYVAFFHPPSANYSLAIPPLHAPIYGLTKAALQPCLFAPFYIVSPTVIPVLHCLCAFLCFQTYFFRFVFSKIITTLRSVNSLHR